MDVAPSNDFLKFHQKAWLSNFCSGRGQRGTLAKYRHNLFNQERRVIDRTTYRATAQPHSLSRSTCELLRHILIQKKRWIETTVPPARKSRNNFSNFIDSGRVRLLQRRPIKASTDHLLSRQHERTVFLRLREHAAWLIRLSRPGEFPRSQHINTQACSEYTGLFRIFWLLSISDPVTDLEQHERALQRESATASHCSQYALSL